MEEVKVTQNIPDDCVEIIFDFCKAFNGAQKKHNVLLSLEESCNFSFDFQGRKFVCNKTYGSKEENSEMCIIDVSQENKNKDNKINSINIKINNNINKNTNPLNDIKEQQNNIALISKQGNSIGSNYYLFVRYNTIFLTKENNDKKFDVYCFFTGMFCGAEYKENDFLKRNTVKIASNIEKKKIQTFFKNFECGKSSDLIVILMERRKLNPTEMVVFLKKFFNANAYSKEEINKINDEANSNLCKFNCYGLC